MEPMLHRACDGCRALKTRCLVDTGGGDACQRCLRFGRNCQFTPVPQRSRRKRTDARVTELEGQLATLQKRIQNSEQKSTYSLSVEPFSAEGYLPPCTVQKASTTPEVEWHSVSLPSPLSSIHLEGAADVLDAATLPQNGGSYDPVSLGLVSMDCAESLVNLFKTEMYGLYPIVYIPPTCSAKDLRREKPTLFMAILAAASGKELPKLAVELDQMAMQHYADRVVLNSDKSLELVQSLLVSSTWYQPPTKLNQFKYTEYVHLAGNMAIDIGIGSRPLDEGQNVWTANLESMRTFAAVLAKAAGVAMTGRKITAIRLNSWGQECLARLEDDKHSDSAPGDRILAAWARLLRITDSISVAFNYDDPGAVASVDDVKTQLMMSALEHDLTLWRHSCSGFDSSPTLKIQYHAAQAYLREAILYVDHRPEDFKVPYRLSPIISMRSNCTLPVKFMVNGLTDLMHASHELLEAFMAIEVDLTRALPLGMFVRVSYACFILTKLCISAGNTQSRLFHFIDRSGLEADSYLKRVLLHVRSAIGPNGSRLPSIFLNLLVQMQESCLLPETLHYMDSLSPEDKEGRESFQPINSANGAVVLASTFSSSSEHVKSSLPSSTASDSIMTGMPASNYERFGNAEAVEFAARHGVLGPGVDIEETLTVVKSALLGQLPTDVDMFESSVSSEDLLQKQPQTTVAYPFLNLDFDPYAELEGGDSAQMHQLHQWDEEAKQPEMPILDETWFNPLS